MQYLTTGTEKLESTPNFKLVGRDNDLKRLISVLLRDKAASAILVGPGGVGVTSIIKGLEELKSQENVPFDVVSKRIFWLKTDDLFSTGDVETIQKGFSSVMNILKRTPDSVLVIEDSRDFIEACRSNGCSHFINSVNSLVKNHHAQVILETRDPDIEMVLSSHSDMRECYTVIDVNEPANGDLIKIVESTSRVLEDHHGIKIQDDAKHAAIELTNKYRSRDSSLNRAQPERSSNLLDRALASYRLEAHKVHPEVIKLLQNGMPEDDERIVELTTQFQKTQARIKYLFKMQRDAEIAIVDLEEQISKEKEEIANMPSSEIDQQVQRINSFSNFASGAGMETQTVRGYRDQIRQYNEVVKTNREEFDTLTASINDQLLLTKDHVLEEFSRLSGIPASKLNENEKEKLRNLESALKSRVFGQDSVVKKISDAVKVSRIGQRNGNKPQASFLIMGPSGTGKTEICKALAHALKDDEGALTRFDMSEYMEKHSVAKLIGAPAGYEGSDRGGILTNAMRQNPHRIILFDEIEKADPAVFDLFLQILSDGRLTDNYGRTVNFSDSMVIMTTNIGQSFFLDENLSKEESERLANVELDEIYRPEFLNRFAGRQNIVCFDRLDIDTIVKIVNRELEALKAAYGNNGLTIEISDEDILQFCTDHYDTKHGARGLQGYIVANIEPLVVNMILSSDTDGKTLTLSYQQDEQSFTAEIG